MTNVYKYLFLFLMAAFLTGCDNPERQKAEGEKVKGTLQEKMGELTNDSETKNKGKLTRTKGDLRDTKENVKDVITGN